MANKPKKTARSTQTKKSMGTTVTKYTSPNRSSSVTASKDFGKTNVEVTKRISNVQRGITGGDNKTVGGKQWSGKNTDKNGTYVVRGITAVNKKGKETGGKSASVELSKNDKYKRADLSSEAVNKKGVTKVKRLSATVRKK